MLGVFANQHGMRVWHSVGYFCVFLHARDISEKALTYLNENQNRNMYISSVGASIFAWCLCESTRNARVAFRGVFLRISSCSRHFGKSVNLSKRKLNDPMVNSE